VEEAAPVWPGPALVVLAGAAGSGKSTWAAQRYLASEIVSSDALRAAVGSGPYDLDASEDAFALLDQIVVARLGRGLTTVVDTLGLDPRRRAHHLAYARAVDLPAVLVVLDTPPALARARNGARDRPVPARVLTEQLRRVRALVEQHAPDRWAPDEADEERWDAVVIVEQGAEQGAEQAVEQAGGRRPLSGVTPAADVPGPAHAGPRVVLQVSRFPWGEGVGDPTRWLTDLARAADAIGLDGIALMDHLVQIPQVDRAWEPIPEPYVALGLLAGLGTGLRLGTLVSPVTFRAPGIVAKAVATLDVLSGGRAFCGLGAGWWLREHQTFGLDLPPAPARLAQLQVTIETLRALWAPGTKAYTGRYVHLPETTCYPRPVGSVPVIVGGSGDRLLRVVAEQADGWNLPSSDPARLARRLAVLRGHCADLGRDPDDVEVTVLDVPVLGTGREDVARRVERLRGRVPAAAFAQQHHAGTAADHAARWTELAASGVGTVFVALPDLVDGDDLRRLEPVLAQLG
jgi:alkanesulfonate monooxygenase SsuD/methylene tetrahydromethanopterin reductase-like flavin-dependent oxidoreductase (luciferase family)/predicted kinase